MATVESPPGRAGYIGRFAPSPTGALHLGSLIAAVASYVDARANAGKWLLRMEDLDPPREPAGAAERILDQLQQLELHWDDDVLYQSQRQSAYGDALEQLRRRQLVYACDCSRQQIKRMGSIYTGLCRNRRTPPRGKAAIRIKTEAVDITLPDAIQGTYSQNIADDVGDFIIRRKDSLFAYQLAVVVDDAFQQINRVVRGYDLLSSTPRQIYLQRCLHLPTPDYAHFPIIVNAQGKKLSKQRMAEPINAENGPRLIHEALKYLGQRPPAGQVKADTKTQLQWAVANWDIQSVPKLANIPELKT